MYIRLFGGPAPKLSIIPSVFWYSCPCRDIHHLKSRPCSRAELNGVNFILPSQKEALSLIGMYALCFLSPMMIIIGLPMGCSFDFGVLVLISSSKIWTSTVKWTSQISISLALESLTVGFELLKTPHFTV